VSSFLQNG